MRQTLPKDPTLTRLELNRIERELGATSTDIRRLSHRLHPAVLEDLGLRIALVRLAEEFQNSGERQVRVEAENVPDDIPFSTTTALYRITQEAFRNIGKHADTAAVTVKITGGPESITLNIEDDGPGFAPSEVRFRGGLGLISMHERASSVGGVLLVTSAPEQGTKIEVKVPFTGSQQ